MVDGKVYIEASPLSFMNSQEVHSMTKKSKYKSSTINNVKFIDSESLYQKFLDPNSKLVKIHDTVDFSFVNSLCDDVYSEDGQNAYLPELVFRVSFIQFYKGGLSDNEVVRQCKTNLEYRYFCNLAIDDDLFDDCKLSRFRAEIGANRFKAIFNSLVRKIKTAGFIDENDVQYMDSFLFLADVKLISINSLISKAIQKVLDTTEKDDVEIEKDKKRRDFDLSDEEQKQRFVFLVQKAQKLLASLKSDQQLSKEAKDAREILARIIKERSEISDAGDVRKKESKEEKDKIVNVSDSDARMMGKSDEVHPSYKAHVVMNKERFITYTDVTLATVYDGHHAPHGVHELKKEGYKVPSCVGDTHYGDILFREQMSGEGTQVIAPYRKNQVMNSCLKEDVMIEAWAYNHTDEYKQHRKKRSQIEPKQGEMKNLHGMRRAKFRGLEKVRIQNYLSAIVTNCKMFIARALETT